MDVKGRKARRRARGDDGDLHGVFAAQANRQDSHVHPPPLPASAPVLPTSNVSDAPGTPSVAAPPTPVPGTATPVPPVPATPSVAAPATPAGRSKATSARIRVSRAPAPPSVAPVPSVAAAAPRPAPAPSVAAPGTPAPSAPATPMSHAPAIVGTSAKSKARPPPPPPSNDEHEEHVSEQLSDGDWSPSHLLSDGEEAESLQSDGEEAEPEVAPADEEENGLTCGICLQPHGKEAVESLECGHVFHSACLDTCFRTAEPTPDPHACPNRCHTFLRRQHVFPTLAEEQADEQAFDAEMMELFG